MKLTKKDDLKKGSVVILIPEATRNPMFSGCMMTVTEPKPWGAQGYVQALGENGEMGGQAYYRARWEEMELVGITAWIAGVDDE